MRRAEPGSSAGPDGGGARGALILVARGGNRRLAADYRQAAKAAVSWIGRNAVP
jgi:hypothetical protein